MHACMDVHRNAYTHSKQHIITAVHSQSEQASQNWATVIPVRQAQALLHVLHSTLWAGQVFSKGSTACGIDGHICNGTGNVIAKTIHCINCTICLLLCKQQAQKMTTDAGEANNLPLFTVRYFSHKHAMLFHANDSSLIMHATLCP